MSATTQTVLTVSDLFVTLPRGADRPYAVNGVSFTVRKGEITCLVGESGSGKSVIASAVMGLLPKGLSIAGGSIRLNTAKNDNAELTGRTEEEFRKMRGKEMAMVFQEPMTALNPVMRCGDQVDELLRCHTTMNAADRKKRILEIFEQVKLPEPPRIYASYPHELSGGQRQRIVIALALILKPALLICDEPTTALDVTTQAEILRLISELQKKNDTAVLFITHDFGVVADIADQVVVLQLGDLRESGPRDTVLQHPSTPYTQSLIDAVPELKPGHAPITDIKARKSLVLADDVSKTYESRSLFHAPRLVHAVQGITLDLKEGHTIGIVGESGSGKSTLARCIARLIEPSGGEIYAIDRALGHATRTQLRPYRHFLQVIFQDPYRSLNPRMTVGESIIEGPVNFGVPREKALQRARELMELVRLSPDALNRYPHEFSGGQRQRISIARALACEPRVLIADEAVSALDVSVQAQILKLLDEIQKKLNLGIIFVTHDLRVASQICDDVLVMHRGKVVERGAARDVLFNPKDDYTKSLLAAAAGRDYPFGRSGACPEAAPSAVPAEAAA